MNNSQQNIDLFYKNNRNISDYKELKIKILNQFSNPQNFQLSSEVGRLKIKSICFEDNNIFYAIPLKTSKKLMIINKNNCDSPIGIEIISNSNVPLITYRSGVYSRNIIKNFNPLKEYEEAYTLEYMLSQIYSVYIEINEFKEFQHIVLEALECFLLENYAAAISLVVSLIEGISRKYCKNIKIKFNERGSQSAFKSLLKYKIDDYIENILLFDYLNKKKYILPTEFKYFENTLNPLLLYYDGGLNIFYSFLKYGSDYLYKSNSDYELNRHSIFHGINKEYCTKINFYRIFSCLECLSFAITLNALGNWDGIKSEFQFEYFKTLHNMKFLKDLKLDYEKSKSKFVGKSPH